MLTGAVSMSLFQQNCVCCSRKKEIKLQLEQKNTSHSCFEVKTECQKKNQHQWIYSLSWLTDNCLQLNITNAQLRSIPAWGLRFEMSVLRAPVVAVADSKIANGYLWKELALLCNKTQNVCGKCGLSVYGTPAAHHWYAQMIQILLAFSNKVLWSLYNNTTTNLRRIY